MSYRNETQNVLKLIGDMEARIAKLEKGNMGIKQQDVRVGDKLISEDSDSNLLVSDLSTGTSFTLPQVMEAPELTFSWSGQITSASFDDPSPVYLFEEEKTIHTVIFTVYNNDIGPPYLGISLRVLDSIGGIVSSYTVNTTVGSSSPENTVETVSITVPANHYLQTFLTNEAGGNWGNMSVTVKWA